MSVWRIISDCPNQPDLPRQLKAFSMFSILDTNLWLGLIQYLADSYKNGSDSEIRQLISSMDIHILVCFIYTFLLQVHLLATK